MDLNDIKQKNDEIIEKTLGKNHNLKETKKNAKNNQNPIEYSNPKSNPFS